LADRIDRAVDDLDETVRQVRSAIFELNSTRVLGRSLRQEVVTVCDESDRALGFEPVVRFDGPIDSAVGGDTADHLLAVLREALANIARHAAASAVTVDIRVYGKEVELSVIDDGKGIPAEVRHGHGLRNMEERAARAGGSVTITSRPGGGTVVTWRARVGEARD
jgi:signal transduction histidine kinase